MDELESAAIVLQAHARGVLVRRRLRTVLQDYEAVVRDIEGDTTTVHWRARLLSVPVFLPVAQCRHTDSITSKSDREVSVQEAGQEIQHHDLAESRREHVSESAPVKDTHIQDVSTTPCQVPDHLLPETHTFKMDQCQLQTESPDGGKILPVSQNERSMLPTQAQHFLHNSSVTSNCESLEWTRSSSVWSDKSMDADLCLKNLNELKMHKSHLAMEILWVQQAISSRKNYLMVRQRLGIQS